MSSQVKGRWTLGLVIPVICALLWASGPTVGQEKKGGEKPAAKEATNRKAGGRLPTYFARVVDGKQREQIYQVQAKYDDQIAQLRKQLEQLIAQRDKEVEEVLTPEQLAEIKKLREQAAAKRRSGGNRTEKGSSNTEKN